MYQAIDDPYCYAGTTVLKNKLGIRDLATLEAFEEEVTRERAGQPLPDGRLSAIRSISKAPLRSCLLALDATATFGIEPLRRSPSARPASLRS